MKTLLIISLLFISLFTNAQNDIPFKYPLKIIATQKINSEIDKEATLYASGFSYMKVSGSDVLIIRAKNLDDRSIAIDPNKIDLFRFSEIDNIYKAWDKNLLINGTTTNLLSNGFQFELRNELNNEAIDLVNTLQSNGLFFNDDYFEDYLYTISNKIHSGLLSDNRPGNVSLKIIKDVEPNARMLPNGCIIISTGLLSTIQSEDELVGILAHEIAHFVLDHQISNYNKEIDRKKRAEFWASFATALAATADIYLAENNENHVLGVLTYSTAGIASIFSDAVISRLGVKYSQAQEIAADNAAKDILEVLKYDKRGLSVVLERIKSYSILTGNYLALSGSSTHPSLDTRINNLGQVDNLETFAKPAYLKKASFINSYNAWLELWYFTHHLVADELVNRNINNGVATESDYIVKAVVQRRLSNTKESNEEVISFLEKAKSLNVTPYIQISKEEGLTYLRLNKIVEAKKAFQTYLTLLNEFEDPDNILEEEINWTKKMIFKVDSF